MKGRGAAEKPPQARLSPSRTKFIFLFFSAQATVGARVHTKQNRPRPYACKAWAVPLLWREFFGAATATAPPPASRQRRRPIFVLESKLLSVPRAAST
ncbi:unnamed protein product [Amoebophrya sp. A120]|nr:unnamed protein product [Amoebophrya sp. A120]|eukprot:GSA120T00023861001.1